MPDVPQITKEKSSWRRWLTDWLLGTVPLPGWVMVILAIVIGVPDWKSFGWLPRKAPGAG
jgi:ribose/xylose/arabinose/galactoside ABC-type transport system permease subunit